MAEDQSAKHCEDLGLLLNGKESRTDGVVIAATLWRGLETALRSWFYDRVYRWYDDVPLTPNDQITLEFQARNEISFFQSVETAFAAKRKGYFTADLPWVIDWLARLNLGADAARQAFDRRSHLYAHSSFEQRFDNFAATLAAVLPQKTGSIPWICRQTPLLATNCLAVAASAFGDSRELEEANTAYSRLREMVDGQAKQQTVPPAATPKAASSGCAILLVPAAIAAASAVASLM